MDLTNSLLKDLVTEYESLRLQIYFKSSMVALARSLQDLVLTDEQANLVIANFQHEKYFRQQQCRFQRMANNRSQVYVLGVPEAESGFAFDNQSYETVPLEPTDTLAGERYLVILGQHYSACLVVREKFPFKNLGEVPFTQQESVFEGFWTFDRNVTYAAADWLLGRINNYRPELKQRTQEARTLFKLQRNRRQNSLSTVPFADLNIFTQRLVTYLQAGQYKLIKAYQAIAIAEKKESSIDKIAAVQRSSLDPAEVLSITVRELGQLFPDCRCILYRLDLDDREVRIEYEFVPEFMTSLKGEKWSIASSPLFIAAQAQESTLVIENVAENTYLTGNPILKEQIERGGIHAWLIVSIRYHGALIGMLELHRGVQNNSKWKPEDCNLIGAVATTAGAALTQAGAYTNLLELNAQLEAVERIQNNLIAIVGHELRTPLSTILVCLESLASEPDMSSEFKNTMLETALSDTERLRHLIQDFLTLSRLEAGKAYQNLEILTVDYALSLALARISNLAQTQAIPNIKVELAPDLPPIFADVDGLVEVFDKLLDNACKFTPNDGNIAIMAKIIDSSETPQLKTESSLPMLEIVVADSGRGIDPELLETIFDRFAQSESYLRRTVSGVGLGLVICRQIIQGLGGQIWAKSRGENQGSEFHFTLPIKSEIKSRSVNSFASRNLE
ncbi:MAG: DICT sensory domain-containing protein [Cyanobacteria bacterium J06600_6]